MVRPLFSLALDRQAPTARKAEKLVTLSAVDVTLVDLIRQVAATSEANVVISQGLRLERVTVDLVDVPFGTALSTIARSVSSRLVEVAGVYYVGDLRAEDRGVFVGRLGTAREDALEIADLLLSDNGRASVTSDGVLVVADTVEVIQSVAKAVNEINAVSADVWVVQLHVVENSVEHNKLIEALGNLSIVFGFPSDAVLTASYAAQIDGELSSRRVRIVSEPVLYCSEGQQTVVSNESEVPFVTSVVVPESGLVTESVEFRPVGLSITATVVSRSSGRGLLTLDYRDDLLLSSEDGLPLTRGLELTGNYEIGHNDTVLLAEVRGTQTTEVKSVGSNLVGGKGRSESVISFYARAYKINGYDGDDPFAKKAAVGAASPGGDPTAAGIN